MFGRGRNHWMLPLIPWVWSHLKKDRVEGASFMNQYEMGRFFSSRNKGLLLDGQNYRLSEKDSFNHLVLTARSGAGKTTRYIIPNIFSLNGASLVITDLKGELYQSTSGYLARQGYTVKALNLQDCHYGSYYNPLARIHSYSDLSSIAYVIIRSANVQAYDKDPIWYKGAETMLKVIISALQGMDDPEVVNLANVLRLLQNMGRKDTFEAFLDRYADDIAWNQYVQLVTSNERMVQSFYTIAVSALDMFNDPEMARLFSQDTLNLHQLRKQKTALYLIVPPRKLSEYSVILNMFYTQLFSSLMERLPTPQDKSVYILGDEWGHTAIPDLDIISTTIRQYRVSLSIVIQSLGQMEKNYGKHATNTILEGGMSAKLFYGGLDTDTGSWVERMVGREVVTSTKQGQQQRYERNLLNADRIRTLGNEDSLLIYGNKEPVLFEDTGYCFEHPRFKRYMQIPPAPLPRIAETPLRYVDIGRAHGKA